MKINRWLLCVLSLCIAGVASAATTFSGGDLLDVANWDNGLPAGQTATINVDGSYSGVNQANTWLSGSTVTIGGGATLTLANDLAVSDSVLVTVNSATINCADDFFVDGGHIVLNAGSITTATDDWEANDASGRITVNGGTHSSGSNTDQNVGAQGSASKVGCGIDFLGGTVTAGNFRFQTNSTSSVGGSAVLASANYLTTFDDMAGLVAIASDWTGSWEVGSFGPGDWESAMVVGGNFTYSGVAITESIFTNYFIVTGDTTLSLNPNPPVNTDPEFTNDPFAASDGTYNVAYTDTIAGSATDPDPDTLVYTKTDGPDWLTIASDGALSGTPDIIGTNEFTVMVDDGRLGIDTATLQIVIPVIGTPPEFTTDPFSTSDGTYGVAYTDTIAGSATDPDPDTLIYTKTGGPAWLIIAPGGALSGTPDRIETNAFTVVVDDGNGNTDTATLQIYIPSPGTVTKFLGGVLTNAANWTIGLPGDAMTNATIDVNGSYTGVSQQDFWMDGSTVTVGSGATLTLADDLSVRGGTMIVNDATLNCSDDVFADGGFLILNAGSATTAVDDWEANDRAGRITVNGGTHSSGPAVDNNVGAQGSASKVGCGIDFLGGTVTAGNFRFQANSTSSVGGSAVLASATASTTFSDMAGQVDFIPGWTGSWEVGSFGVGDWETALTGGGNFTLNGIPIDAIRFAANFIVSTDGKTLTMVALPPEDVGNISITTISADEVEISWTGVAGHSYAVEYKRDLVTDLDWLVYTNGISGTGTITVTLDAILQEAFYQVAGQRD